MVYWAAFDMDSTLGYFGSVVNYLTCFAPWILNDIFKKPHYDGPPLARVNLPNDLNEPLMSAFYKFVQLMSVDEQINKLIRPGILPVLKKLLEAKRAGKVGGIMIYSNNSSIVTVLFCQELIRILLGESDNVFNPALSWLSSIRKEELKGYKNGNGPKTVETIKHAFKTVYKEAAIRDEDILFFDDLIHPDIKSKIPEANYFHVQPYEKYCDIKKVHTAFLNACLTQRLPENKLYKFALKKIGYDFTGPDAGLDSMMANQPVGYNKPVRDDLLLLNRVDKLLKPTGNGGRRKTRKNKMLY